jgi:protocatechuate 3,4-dioxygenase alpha subunit
MPDLTPYQTVGPFFEIALGRIDGAPNDEVNVGERISVGGFVFDGNGTPIPDALIEVWHADALGRYNHPDHGEEEPIDARGFVRAPTDDAGSFSIDTIKPGRVAGPDGALQAPHLVVGVHARGVLTRFVTRIYFDDEPSNADDPVLRLVPEHRRSTLVAPRTGSATYRFDIVLQGDERHETVFFDV